MEHKKMVYDVKACMVLLMFFLGNSIRIVAQDACVTLLKNVNNNAIFPSEREKEYFECLKKQETQFTKMISDQQAIKQNQTRQNSDLKVKKDSRQQAIDHKDSAKIVQYSKEVESISATIKSLDSTLEKLNPQVNENKNLLMSSYDRVLKYFRDEMPASATNDKIKEYNDKKEKLRQMS